MHFVAGGGGLWWKQLSLLVAVAAAGLASLIFQQSQVLTTTTTTPLSSSVTTKRHRDTRRDDDRRFCTWSPQNGTECKALLSKLICDTAPDREDDESEQRTVFQTTVATSPKRPAVGRRVLMLGDSTMGPNFLYGSLSGQLVREPVRQQTLQKRCPGRYSCQQIFGDKCRYNDRYGLNHAPQWKPPQPGTGIGPKPGTGQFCTSCRGCKSHLLSCRIANATKACGGPPPAAPQAQEQQQQQQQQQPLLLYGGYVTVEYARDVEMQSSNYTTTQENVLRGYVERVWNTAELMEDFGKPICLVGVGHHDAAIPGITVEQFADNVRWYLHLLLEQCSAVIWLGNNAPTDEPTPYPQTVNSTRRWNAAVRELIRTNFTTTGEGGSDDDSDRNQNNKKIVYVDVFNASLTYPHRDHIHMQKEWYWALAATLFDFQTLIRHQQANCTTTTTTTATTSTTTWTTAGGAK